MLSRFLILVLVPLARGAPTLPSSEDVRGLVTAAAADVSNLAVAKAAAIGFAGGVAVNSASLGAESAFEVTVNSGNKAYDAALGAGEAALEAAVDAGGAAIKYVSQIDAIDVLDETEEAVRGKNDAIISGVFNAKRHAIKSIREIAKQNTAAVHAFINATSAGLNAAINSTQHGLSVSKQLVSDVAAQVTIENAQLGISTAQGAVNSAFDATLTAVESSGAALINSLIKAKQGLQQAAENFDSKEAIKNTKENVGAAISLSVDEAGKIIENAGIYAAIDNIVHSLAGVPTAINQYLTATKQLISEEFQVIEEEEIDAAIAEEEEIDAAITEEEEIDAAIAEGGTATDEDDAAESSNDEVVETEAFDAGERKTAREFTEEELLDMLKEVEKNKDNAKYY